MLLIWFSIAIITCCKSALQGLSLILSCAKPGILLAGSTRLLSVITIIIPIMITRWLESLAGASKGRIIRTPSCVFYVYPPWLILLPTVKKKKVHFLFHLWLMFLCVLFLMDLKVKCLSICLLVCLSGINDEVNTARAEWSVW